MTGMMTGLIEWDRTPKQKGPTHLIITANVVYIAPHEMSQSMGHKGGGQSSVHHLLQVTLQETPLNEVIQKGALRLYLHLTPTRTRLETLQHGTVTKRKKGKRAIQVYFNSTFVDFYSPKGTHFVAAQTAL